MAGSGRVDIIPNPVPGRRPAPLIVRYGWAEYPALPLYNSEGLSTPPFREIGNGHAATDAINAPPPPGH
jgi:hypothetical protein